MRKNKFIATILLLLIVENGFSAINDTILNYSKYNRKFTPKVLFIGYNISSLTDSIDVNGTYQQTSDYVKNSFAIRYMRVSADYKINDKFDVSVMVNLANFKTNPTNKVLETAFARYKFNNYATIQFGQYRPYFGLENIYGIALHKSYFWSDQYEAFNKNNWMGYQLGASIYGSLNDIKIPVKYFFNLYNGNGINKISDNNTNKNISSRIEIEPFKNIVLGANYAIAKLNKKNTSAYNFDFQLQQKVSEQIDIEFEASYANGTNIVAFQSINDSLSPNINDYRINGFYLLPLIRYNLSMPRFRAVEFSFRYENLNYDKTPFKVNKSSFIPVLSFVFADNYDAKVSIVGIINKFNEDVKAVNRNNNSILLQVQFKF